MSVISGNNYTYTGTVLNNSIGYLIQRTPTANSSDTLPTAAELILAYVGVQDASNNGQSLTISVYNNSAFTITMNPNTGLTFINSLTDTILPQAVRTYTFVQTSATAIVAYIIGAAPVVVSQTNTNISLTSGSILVGNSSNIASGVSMTGDSTITNAGVVAVNRIAGVPLGSTAATSGNLLIGSGTAWATNAMTGDSTITSTGIVTVGRIKGAVLGTTTATAGNLLVGSGTQWGSVSVTGDSTITSAGVIAVNRIAGTPLGTTTATAGNLLIGSGTQWGSVSMTGDATIASNGSLTLNTVPVLKGGTGVTSVTTVPTATTFAGWDSNNNLSANNHIQGYVTTATAAGTTTLTVASDFQQYFTGTTTQTVVMPVTSTLVLGMSWYIVNNSTGIVTINSSGSNLITALSANTSAILTCILVSGTTAASWSVQRVDLQPRITYITSGTTYTTPSFINTETLFKITLVGAGGGGGGAGASDRGCGGGGGGVGVIYRNGLSPNTGYTIVVGVGGTGGTTGGSGVAGTSGGNTTFTIGLTTYQASGGAGGGGGAVNIGGVGGTMSGGTFSLQIVGGQGGGGSTTNLTANTGYGGGSGLGYGVGGAGRINLGVGGSATGYGGGGGGGNNGNIGGAGTGGLIVIEYVA